MDELYYQSIGELAPQIQQKILSPVELTDAVLKRVEAENPKLNAYITVLGEEALEQARKAEREIMAGNWRGPLHGIPMALKDLFYTQGVRTTAGSALLKDFVPQENATVVNHLLDAGVILTGKLNMHELAFGATNENPHFGDAHNPWDGSRITGGSSGGGAAAVAAGLSVASLGTDTGGSIRTPSALCGVTGLKPTFGLVSKHGVVPLAWSLDHVGPIGRSVEDIAILLEAIAGPDAKDPTTKKKGVGGYRAALAQGAKGLRAGVVRNYYLGAQPDVEKNLSAAVKALETAGVEIIDIQIPELDVALFAEMITISAEASAYHHENLAANPQSFGTDVRILLEAGELITAVQYIKAQQARRLIQAGFDRTFRQVDVLIAPTVPLTAPPIGMHHLQAGEKTIDVTMAFVQFAAPANLAGLPALSLPTGLSSEGLPTAMQILGKPFAEETVLRVGAEYEAVSPFRGKHPIV
ncbi:MAG: amidase [Desulfitobacteriaceae bacterium]